MDALLCTVDIEAGVAVIAFNRPEHGNGMTGDMELEYFRALLAAEADPDVRAIVVTGNGRTFCPGADLAHRAEEGQEPLPNTKLRATVPLGIGKPMIAAINGACAGAGLAYALQCDVRFAAEGAKFTTAFVRRGLISEYGMAWLLTQIAGRAIALDLLLSGRVFLADEALRLGLVSEVLPPDQVRDRAIAYARDLAANCSPASMATIKREVTLQADSTYAEALDDSDELMRESLTGVDVKQGIESFLRKQPVQFAPLGHGSIYRWMTERPGS